MFKPNEEEKENSTKWNFFSITNQYEQHFRKNLYKRSLT